MTVEIELGKVIAGFILFLITNAIILYYGSLKKQIIQGKDIAGLKETLITYDPAKTHFQAEENKRSIEQINDYYKAGNLADTLKRLGVLEKEISELEPKIEQANSAYKSIQTILNDLDIERENLERVKQLLETISKNHQGIQIINEFEGFKHKLRRIEDAQNSQYVIKAGMDWKSISDGKETTKEVSFHHSFINPPEVFVALAKFEAKASDSTRKIRVDLSVKDKSNDKCWVSAKTWGNSSRVYDVGFLWIAIGK